MKKLLLILPLLFWIGCENLIEKEKWKTTFTQSSFDDSQTVVVSLEAESKIKGFLESSLPKLIFRCKEGSFEIYIKVGVQQDVEQDFENSTVRIRYDKEPAFQTKMGHSTSGDALFFKKPNEVLLEMVKHKTMVFGFTPFNASPVQTSFDLTEIRENIQPLINSCTQ
tara:strand:- start:600 stop:1100 length:501 start_codon:yes stop_codon:yes gene_type:complete